MRAKIVIPPKAAVFEKFVLPADRKGMGQARGGEDTKYSQSELQSSIPGGTFGTCNISSHGVICKKELVNALNIIKGERYQIVLGIQLAFQNVLFHYKIMKFF